MTENSPVYDASTGQRSRRKTFLGVVSFNAIAWFVAVMAIALAG